MGNIQKSLFSTTFLLLFTVSFGLLFGTAIAAPKPITKAQLNAQIAAVNAARAAADSAEAAARQAADSAEASTRQATDNALSAAINSSKHFIGEQYGGGIVFYVYDDGQHGLIAAKADAGAGVPWSNGTNKNTGATGDGIGAGEMNTAIIVAAQSGDAGTTGFAAKVAADFRIQDDGVSACTGSTNEQCYGDWYLPSRLELELLYLQKAAGVVGGLNNIYWSATETAQAAAVAKNLAINFTLVSESKLSATSYRVRPIRAF